MRYDPPKNPIARRKRHKKVSPLDWGREVLLNSATQAFFGDRHQQIDPDLFSSFYKFDEMSWKVFYKYPRFWSTGMDAAKDRILDALTMYFRLPKDERKGESWLIANLEEEIIKLGIEDVKDIAAIIMPLYWV